MYSYIVRRLGAVVIAYVFSSAIALPAAAQSIAADRQQQAPAAPQTDDQPPPPHDMQHMKMDHDHMMAMPSSREGSGTSWLPDDTPMYALHGQAAGWSLMAHGSAFLQYLHDGGDRGNEQ